MNNDNVFNSSDSTDLELRKIFLSYHPDAVVHPTIPNCFMIDGLWVFPKQQLKLF